MTNLSQQLCEICGIREKWVEYTTETTDGCVGLGKKRVFPDFTEPENFAKLFKLIVTLEDFYFTTGNFCIPTIPSYRQETTLVTDDETYYSSNSDPIQAFITCVIRHCIQNKDTVDYIKNEEWNYE